MVHKATSKSYARFCSEHKADLPLFYQPWYLDASCGHMQWQALIYQDNNQTPLAIWPYYVKNKYGIKYITMPMLTPYMGPWIIPPKQQLKRTSHYRRQHKIISALTDHLPRTTLSLIHAHPDMTDLIAIHWKGFKEQKRYTYRLALKDQEVLWRGVDSKQKNIIRNAENHLKVTQSSDINMFYSLNQKSFERQQLSTPYTKEDLKRLDHALELNSQRIILVALDSDGAIHGSIYLTFDDHTVYLLAIGSDPQYRHKGSIPLLIWTALRQFSQTHKVFDFEGSMLPSIESFFRSFGGELTPYSRLSTVKNSMWELILKMSGKYD